MKHPTAVVTPKPRTRLRRTLVLGAVGLTAMAWSGCQRKEATELVAGVSTQVQVPRDLKAVRIDVNLGGFNFFCKSYRVYDGKVQLPRTLGTLPIDDSKFGQPITITIAGFQEEPEGSDLEAFINCTAPPRVDPSAAGRKDGGGARVLRRSRQPYLREKILFLPMPIKYSCFDVDCANADQTCKGGRCVDNATDPETLPEYREDLIDGSGGNCFNVKLCTAGALPPVTVDAETCTYAVANSASAPPLPNGVTLPFPAPAGPGLNVIVAYDGGFTEEILDVEKDEGFTIPDPTKPQQFTLSPGLCDLVKGKMPDGKPTAHRITAIRAATLCAAKSKFQPLCKNDQLAAMGANDKGDVGNPNVSPQCKAQELSSAPSALMVVVDRTERMNDFYGDKLLQTTFGLSLSDPAFQSTKLGLLEFPTPAGNECATNPNPFLSPEVPPTKLAADARKDIVAEFLQLTSKQKPLLPAAQDLNLDRALEGAYGTLAALGPADAFNKRGVLLIGNHDFVKKCQALDLPVLAAQQKTQNRIFTYAVLLGKEGVPDPNVALQAEALAAAGAPDPVPAPPVAFDARSDTSVGARAFQKVVRDLATCVYDQPPPPVGSQTPLEPETLTYVNPLAPGDPVTGKVQTITLARNPGCTSESSTASGWGYDGKRIRICGQACEDLRTVIRTVSDFAALTAQPALAVPVFATTGCGPAPAGPSPVNPDGGAQSDAGSGADSGPSDAGTD